VAPTGQWQRRLIKRDLGSGMMARHRQQDLPAQAGSPAPTASNPPAGNTAYQPRTPGGPGYHDPTAGIGGAAPARSALTLRLVLAGFGLLVCAAGAVLLALAGVPAPWVVTFAVLALVAAVDIVVIARRKRRGEPF
jgi:hypothetical protein